MTTLKFPTPPLRNTAITGLWCHGGAYNTLEGLIRHHLHPVTSLNDYDTSQRGLPTPGRPDNPTLGDHEFSLHNNATTPAAIAATNELRPRRLSKRDLADIIDFMRALTDLASPDQRHSVPTRVPSSLPLSD